MGLLGFLVVREMENLNSSEGGEKGGGGGGGGACSSRQTVKG